jgi:5'-methylthioadenosine phosphorylase
LKAEIGIIGGTGLYDPDMLKDVKKHTISTVYGDAVITLGCMEDKKIAFLARHGGKHTVPPHLVNYRANISAFKEIGVEKIISTASVGSLNTIMEPGDLVILDQFMDFTKSRPLTFYEGGDVGVVHIDMTAPYCPQLRALLYQQGENLEVKVHPQGVYVCTEGPRFETPAEIKMYQHLGGDLVGMTNVPEVVLAREIGICYATIAIVTNYAAGISPDPLSHAEVVEAMRTSVGHVRHLLQQAIAAIPQEKCNCVKDTGKGS